MRDLHKIITLLANDSSMEYCEEFDQVKSVLEHCNRNVKPFSKLHFRGGNEPFINELTSRFQELLSERKLVDASSKIPLPKADNVLRKITMFLMVNTDATYKYNLRQDPFYAHVLELCPLIPKFLLVALMWELNLDKYFYEALSYTPCWFAFQYFEAASDSLKYTEDPYAVLEKVEKLICSIYTSMTRSEQSQLDTVDRKIIFGKLYDCTMNLLRQFYTPDVEKFKKFSKKQFCRYSGFALKHILQLVLFAFDVYEDATKAEPVVDMTVYKIRQDICKKVSRPALDAQSQTLKDHQLKIVTALLNSLQYNVMLVKIDVFIYWVEVDLTPTDNLQMVIGEMAYKVGERMWANHAFLHDVAQQLKMVAIRPKTLEEQIHEATLGDVLRSLDEPLVYEIKKAWFDELFNRTVALGNDECQQSIKDNIKLMSVENCRHILDFIKLEIQRNQGDNIDTKSSPTDVREMEIYHNEYEELTSLILLSLHNFKNEQILTLLDYQTQQFGISSSICCKASDFQLRSTEFLNKYVSSFDLQKFLILCFEHPKEMWSKFFEGACHNCDHAKNFCSTVQQTRPFSNAYFQTLLNEALSDKSKMEQKLFPQLLFEIYFVLYFPDGKTEFLKQFVNKNVNALLDAQHFAPLLPLVKSLNLIATHGETQSHKPLNFGDVTAPVLLMAAQIMDKTRWDLITYTDMRDEIVRECIQFIQHTSKIFLPVATEKDRKWITKVIKDSYRPITQYYFQKFALSRSQPTVDFDRFLIRFEIQDKSEAEMFLIINYVRCTMKETEWLARSERLLPHISDVMLILAGVVIETNNPNSINNYRHCLVNYANIVVKFILPQIESADSKKIEKLELKVLKIIESTPAQIYEEMFMNFECILLEILKKCTKPLDDSSIKAVEKFVTKMKDCQAKDIFFVKFKALTIECLT